MENLSDLLLQCKIQDKSSYSYISPFIDKLIPAFKQLESEDREQFSNLFKPFSYPENYHLLKEFEVSDRLYILFKGIARMYMLDENNEQKTIFFFFPGDFILKYPSTVYQKPSGVYIDLLMPSSGWYANWADIQQFTQQHPIGLTLKEMIVSSYIQAFEEYNHKLKTLTAKEHYRLLIKEKPEYIKEIDSQIIASYLGIRKGSLSRIKNEI